MEDGKGRVTEKGFNFALEIMELYKELIRNSEFVISKQLLKTATSIGANVNEAQAGGFKKRFFE